MAYKCRAYPNGGQRHMLARTFGCVRLVWNRTLAERRRLYHGEGKGLSYAASDAALTVMKRDPGLAFLAEVSSVPLQQTLRHQHQAFQAFFAKRARYPRFKSRAGRQSATYTRSAFRMKDGALWLAKMDTPLAFVWSWPGIDPATLDPATVTVSRDPCGRWYVSFAVEVADPGQSPATGAVVGIDLGIKDFAVTSGGAEDPQPAEAGPPGTSPGPVSAPAGPLPARFGEPGQSQGEGRPRAPEGPRVPHRFPAPHLGPAGPRP